jgi:putative ABC transport system permease protein
MLRALQLAMRMLGREWKSGELGVLMLALTVAVAALTGVGFLVNRISQAVDAQATAVLAADLRVESPRVLPVKYLEEAQRRGLRTSSTASILSMVFRGDVSQLSNVRAVGEGYPLRGMVGIADEPFGVATMVAAGPKPGEAWPESKLLATLDAKTRRRDLGRRGDAARDAGADFPARSGRRFRRTRAERDDQPG